MRQYPVEEFLWGLGAGTVALVLAAAMAALHGRPGPGGRVPVTGLPMGAAALWAISSSRVAAPEVLLGLAGVAAASALAGWRRSVGIGPLLAALLVAAPFAWLLAIDASSTAWVRAVVVGSATVGSVAGSRTDAGWGATGLPPVLYAVTAAGVFAAVPNTREAAALLGASVPGALAAWPLGRARLGRAGAGGATALLVWVAAVGARGREPAIVGAVACLGLLAALPAGRWLAGRWPDRWARAPRRAVYRTVLVLVAHTAIVTVASRVAGISAELRVAVPVAAATVVAALVVSTWLEATRAPSQPVVG